MSRISFTPRPQSFWQRNIGYVFILIGLPFLILAVYFGYDSWKFTQNSEKTVGKVIDFQERYTNKKGKYRGSVAPIIEFQTPDGKKHLYYHDVYSRPPMYDIDEEVMVYYEANNPENATLGFSWTLLLTFGFLGSIFTGLGFLFKKFLRF